MGGSLRDWSLSTGRGAMKREGGGHGKFYPYENKGGGGRTGFSSAEGGGGHTTFWGSLYAVARSLAILKAGATCLHSLKGGGGGGGEAQKVLPCLERGAWDSKSFGPAIFPFCCPHPPPHSL